MLQNATLLRKSAPWPPNISDEHVLCTAPAMRHASLQILFKCPTPAIVFANATKPSRFAHFWEGAQSLAPATRNDIWTSNSGPNPWCFFKFWTWQHQNQSNSARLLQVLNLTTSKSKQFCETSFKNWKLSAALTASYQCVLRFFHSTCLKYCACHEKLMPGHTKCCTSHANHRSKPTDLMLQMQPFSGNQRPDLLTSLMNMSCVLRLPCDMHLCRSSSNVPRLPSFLQMLQNPHVFAHFWEGAQSLAPATRNDIWTSKSGPNPWCF